MTVPTDRSYTPDHEWVIINGALATIGITAFAADELGGVTYIDLPEAGSRVTLGTQCGEIESTKTVEDLISPVTGTVTEVNTAAVDNPDVVGSDPYGQGWLYTVTIDADNDLSHLLDADAYSTLLAN